MVAATAEEVAVLRTAYATGITVRLPAGRSSEVPSVPIGPEPGAH